MHLQMLRFGILSVSRILLHHVYLKDRENYQLFVRITRHR